MVLAAWLAQGLGPALDASSDVDKFLSFTVAGLSVAAILAVGASGLVLTYTTTGVFNFAHGAIGMLGAFAYWQLRFDWGWPAPLAVATVLFVLGPLFGALLELVIFRGLQQTTETVKLVVTVSLLFSLLEVNPSPFCVLDEVDAMLDEANVGRFAGSLRGLAERTQFIVITHNRRTIEVADNIYGISMAPDAASRVLSMRLADVTGRN